MAGPAWLPLYVGDYLRDTSRLSTEQHGAYFLLLLDEWANGPLPDNDEHLAAIARLTPDRWAAHRPTLAGYFQVRRGQWVNPRLEAERERTERKIAQRIASGRRGGHAKNQRVASKSQTFASRLLEQNPTNHIQKEQKDLNQGSNPVDQTSSNASTDSIDGKVVRLPLPDRGRA